MLPLAGEPSSRLATALPALVAATFGFGPWVKPVVKPKVPADCPYAVMSIAIWR